MSDMMSAVEPDDLRRELVPAAARVAVLVNTANPNAEIVLGEVETAEVPAVLLPVRPPGN
jgi:hypothetical protein